MSNVKAVCRSCGGAAPADQFKLHHGLGQMVCPACYTGKTQKAAEKQKAVEQAKKEEPPRPPGWDAEDAYLEKMTELRRRETQAQFSKVPGSDFVKCTCNHCKYQFRYNPATRVPRTCPYCDMEVPKVKSYML